MALIILVPVSTDINIQIFSFNGQLVVQDKIKANDKSTITLEHLKSGLYFVQFEEPNSKEIIAIERLVINR